MLQRLMAFISALPGEGSDRSNTGAGDPRVAAAALMFHIIDADGVREDEEWQRLRDMLSNSYSVEGKELDDIVAKGEAADRDAVDLFAFTSVLNRQLDETAKIEFIGVLWEMVYADGEMHELEDNIVWRVAELIGVAPRDRVTMRQRVRDEQGIERAGDD